ncbi:importin subunit beta-1 [Nematocida major]|uniref:importin subunit beta-1 n=1 Tax=Nematocida major TaxID=1912982 RepID=UPI002008CD4A|nr:importin subunit beta-1 [Nematocida major]KAH9386612.1 importin subunit beta-1 [Nematocida major]
MQQKVLSSLNSLQGIDNLKRKEAEKYIIEESNRNFSSLIGELLNILTDPSVGTISNTVTAGVVLRTLFSWESEEKREEVGRRWSVLTEEEKVFLKKKMIHGLDLCTGHVGEVLGQCLGAVARFEVVSKRWPSVFSDLAEVFMGSKTNTAKINVMETIGVLCMDTSGMDANMIVHSSGHILTVLVDGARSQDAEMQKSALKNLDRCLEFISYNVQIENECMIVMETLFNACASENEAVACLAMQCYTGTLFMYYSHVVKYVGLAFGNIALEFMHSESEKKVLAAIEMWHAITQQEMEGEGEIIGKMFPALAGQCLILCMNKDLEQFDEWVPHKAAAWLLESIAQCVPEKVSGKIVSKLFNSPVSMATALESFFGCNDMVKLEAAMIALGSVLNEATVNSLSTLIKREVVLIDQLLGANNQVVQDSAMWVLEKIFKFAYPAVEQSQLENDIIRKIMKFLSLRTEASVTAAWTLAGIASTARTSRVESTREHTVCAHFTLILETLTSTFNTLQENEYTLKVALSMAISEVVRAAPQRNYGGVFSLLSEIISRTRSELANSTANEETLSCYMNMIQSCIYTCLPDQILQASSDIVQVCIFIIHRGHLISLYTEAYLTLGALADKLGIDFGMFAEDAVCLIVRDLTTFCAKEEAEEGAAIFATSLIVCIGSIAAAIQLGFTAYIDTVMPLLVQAVRSPSLPREAKATAVSTFADISLAVGMVFDRYMKPIMAISSSIIKLKDEGGDSGFILTLRESLLVLLSCIVQSSDGKSEQVAQEMGNIMEIVKTIATETNDSACVIKSLYLISDAWLLYGTGENPEVMAVLESSWIFQFIGAKVHSEVREVRDAATATRLQISYVDKN